MTIKRQSIFKVLAAVLLCQAVLHLIALIVSLIFNEKNVSLAFATTFALSVVSGLVFVLLYKNIKLQDKVIHRREGFRLLIGSWFLLILLSALPYMLSGYGFVDSWFESSSGWTTTGATVLDMVVEPRSLLFFRALTSWAGGLLIVAMVVTVFPALNMKDQWLSGNEVSESSDGKISARFWGTIKIAVGMYLGITALCMALLIPSRVDLFYSILNALMAVSTSGVIDPAACGGVAEFTVYSKIIITIVAYLSSINYMVYYNLVRRKFSLARKNYETAIYTFIVLAAGIAMGLTLFFSRTYSNFFVALGNGFMETISFSSTSGFVMSNISGWPVFTKAIMIIIVLVGGCSFSSASGIKVSRAIINFKMISYEIYKRIHPRAFKNITVNKKPVPLQKMSSLSAYVLMFFCILILGTVLMSIEDKGLELTLCSVISTMTNTGTSFAMTDGSFAMFSAFGRFVSSILMTVGRLEIFPVVFLFSRSFWNNSRTR